MKSYLCCAVILMSLLTACSQPDSASEPSAQPSSSEAITMSADANSNAPVALNFAEVARAFSEMAIASSQTALARCSQMKADVNQFLTALTDEAQAQAQASYIECYQSWVSTTAYFQQPFELSETIEFEKLVDLIDTRPYLPGYIDGIPEYPYSGLIHELDLPISLSTLLGQHRLMDEESASLGFPVIEFFLWKTPLESVWVATNVGDNVKIAERRREYLKLATQRLLEDLTKASLRWQSATGFMALPERAQLALVLKSLQRIALVELQQHYFESEVLTEPEWFHPSIFSGNGREYPLLHLAQLNAVLSNPAFKAWADQQAEFPFLLEEMLTTLGGAQSAILQLPENYPFDTTQENEHWLAARQQVATLAMTLSQLSERFHVPVVTE